jgi:hypothetical protein
MCVWITLRVKIQAHAGVVLAVVCGIRECAPSPLYACCVYVCMCVCVCISVWQEGLQCHCACACLQMRKCSFLEWRLWFVCAYVYLYVWLYIYIQTYIHTYTLNELLQSSSPSARYPAFATPCNPPTKTRNWKVCMRMFICISCICCLDVATLCNQATKECVHVHVYMYLLMFCQRYISKK